jgi:hypothetical protein
MSTCTLRYRSSATAAEVTLEYPAERLPELLARADAKFLPPWTAQDEIRFRAILADDEKRRLIPKRSEK